MCSWSNPVFNSVRQLGKYILLIFVVISIIFYIASLTFGFQITKIDWCKIVSNKTITIVNFEKVDEHPMWNTCVVPLVPFRKKYSIQASKDNKTKYILYWGDFFGDKSFEFGFGSEIFKNCPVNKCYATANSSLIPVEEFDAILFDGAKWNSEAQELPNKRSLKQKYIFYSLESGFNPDIDMSYCNNFFNWTMGNRRDADIYRPHGFIAQMKTNYSMPTKETIAKKQIAAWMVSNCRHTRGVERRPGFFKELRKYIPVKTYGACYPSNETCNRATNGPQCAAMIARKYKFYFAVENSMCPDYVSENVYEYLARDVVLVVFGRADYKKYTPPNSVIDAFDFEHPKDLADYLIKLDRNPELYLKYFEWKKDYVYFRETEEYAMCQLCDKLHRPLQYFNVGNVAKWYMKDCYYK